MRLILTAEHILLLQGAVCRNGQLCSGTDYFGCPCFLLTYHWLLMVTIERLLPYSYWIGHPVSNRAIVYLFAGFIPLTVKDIQTLYLIIQLNTVKWELKCRRKRPERMRLG